MATTINNREQESRSGDMLNRLLAQAYTLNWELITYIVIFFLAVFTRFYMLGERVMSHDESLHTRYSYNLARDGNFQHTPLMHGPILFHFTAMFYFLFGANDFTSRLYAAVLGVLIVMMPILFRRWLGRWGAILASIMLLISPITMYYHRYIRHDTPNIFFSLLMIYGMFMYVSGPEAQRRRAHWLYLIAGAMIMNLGSKETAFIYIFIFGIYLAAFWFVRLFQDFRGIRGRTLFLTLIMAFCVGGIAALGMFVTLSINLGERPFFQAITTLANYGTFAVWTLAVIVGIVLIVSASNIAAFSGSRVKMSLMSGLTFFSLSFIVSVVLIYAEELSRLSHNTTGVSEPVVPEGSSEVIAASVNNLPIIAAWVIAALLLGIVIILWRRGIWTQFSEDYPEFDLIILIGSLILPWAAPFVIAFTGASPTDYSPEGIQRAVAVLIPMFILSAAAGLLWDWKKWTISLVIFYSLFGFFFTTMFTNPNGLATGLIGSLGYWLEQQEVRRGNQPQYYYLTIIMPVYEYLPVIGSIFATFGGLTWYWRFRRDRLEDDQERNEAILADVVDDTAIDSEEYNPISPVDEIEADIPQKRKPKVEVLEYMPFLPFVAWWAVLNLIGYTLAGEKMPWLAIHLTLPMIFLTAWFFGRIFDRIDVAQLRNLGWIYILLLPLLFILIARIIAPFIFGNPPLSGLSTEQLSQTGEWIALVAIAGLVMLAVVQLVERTGWAHLRHMTAVSLFALLAVFTFRAAWMASFINYDLANEYLVYAHAAPAVKNVLDEIEELSLRTTDGYDLNFVYDNEVSWPYSWYFRDFPNGRFVGSSPNAQQIDDAVVAVVGDANRSKFEPLLEDRYHRFEYIRLWWPMQDYFNLTPARVANTFDFSPNNPNAGEIRRGLWDIWWDRDYTTYGEALDKDFALTRWPVSDRMHFYVRKDFVAQVWDMGIGEGTVPGIVADEVNVCNANWQPVPAEQFIGQGMLSSPIGLSVLDDGTVYVAEQFGHRIAVFDGNGEFVETLGQAGRVVYSNLVDDQPFTRHTDTLGSFERPHSVDVDQDGNLYIADTWNYRVQVLSPEGEALRAWGQPEELGADVGTLPVDGFWGPRDIVVDNAERVFVADTGNKRIRVYDSNGNFLFDVGSAGSGDGELNEPAGLATHSDGRLFVADTWNRRISVFNTDGAHLYNFRVRGWYNELGNRPYIAIDETREMVYVTDPDAGRVLVYNLNGDCIGSFGQAAGSDETIGDNQFRVAAGIDLDAEGNVYVVDSGTARIARYAPFMPPSVELDVQMNDEDSDPNSVDIEIEVEDDTVDDQE